MPDDTTAAAPAAATDGAPAPAEGASAPPVTETVLTDQKPPETPPEGQDAQPEGDAKPDEKSVDAPEAYDTFSVSEGMNLDQAAVDAFTPVARELNLTQEQAQKLVDVWNDRQQAQFDAHVKQMDDWAAAAKADKEIGGADHQEKFAVANKALDRFSTPGLTKLLQQTGLANHPDMVRVFYRIGKTISDDAVVLPGTTGGSRGPQTMYPNSNMR